VLSRYCAEFVTENARRGALVSNEQQPPEPPQESEREAYVPPAVEDIDTTYGPAETSAGVPGSWIPH
jgi:hypothetical protein